MTIFDYINFNLFFISSTLMKTNQIWSQILIFYEEIYPGRVPYSFPYRYLEMEW